MQTSAHPRALQHRRRNEARHCCGHVMILWVTGSTEGHRGYRGEKGVRLRFSDLGFEGVEFRVSGYTLPKLTWNPILALFTRMVALQRLVSGLDLGLEEAGF